MVTRRRIAVVGRAVRRNRVWITKLLDGTIGGGGVVLFDLLDGFLGTYGTEPTDHTCVRMIGDLYLGKTATTDKNRFVLGVIGVSEQAFAAGASSVPDPTAQFGANWTYTTAVGFPNVLEGASSPAGHTRIHFDIKAKRKLMGENRVLCLVMTNTLDTVRFLGQVKVLLLAP